MMYSDLALILIFFFFFKQKTAYEILTVTGVQTCALPISLSAGRLYAFRSQQTVRFSGRGLSVGRFAADCGRSTAADRKSTRLNSSHSQISYAVFCLKKKKETIAFPLRIYKTRYPVIADTS